MHEGPFGGTLACKHQSGSLFFEGTPTCLVVVKGNRKESNRTFRGPPKKTHPHGNSISWGWAFELHG